MARRKSTQTSGQIEQVTSPSAYNQENLLNRITTRIRQSLDLPEILMTAAQEIRAWLATDRVKIYRFQPDETGEVIAEALMKGSDLPSLLGLRFPASDIPPHVRELFIKARQRVIVDVAGGCKIQEWLDSPTTGKSLVVEDIRYSPLDSCHQQYLTAMGVYSSLAVPILHQNQLWGLLVSHHTKPRHFAERELRIVQLLVDQVSIAIAQSNLLQSARQQANSEAIINRISSLLHSPLALAEIRQSVLEETISALDGSGGRLYITAEPTGQPARLYTCGDQPNLSWLEETPDWENILNSRLTDAAKQHLRQSTGNYLKVIHPTPDGSDRLSEKLDPKRLFKTQHLYTIPDIYQEPQFQSLAPAFCDTTIRSIVIVPLRYHQQSVGYLSIFRSEIETETLWAGRLNPDDRNLRPRKSFASWRQITKGQAQAWSPDDFKLAQAVGIHLYMAVMQRRVEDMMRHQASHDLLTGLPNRMLFNNRLQIALANLHSCGELVAVVFLDLDGFKTINDTLGHDFGDVLLQSAAHRLTECLREGDIVARWGGDEFTLLLSPISNAEEAANVAKKILQCLNAPFECDGQELNVKASLGIAIAPYDGEDADTLLKNADAAMYRAKQQGRNNYQMYTPAIGNKALERLVLENNLYKALERQEFLLHYQPQANLKTGQIAGMEALIRWQSNELGFISPTQFIPLAEETGLICPIGEWVLRTACTQNKLWQQLGLPPIRIAVNLSARQFQQPNLLKTIAQILEETGLEAQYLELEITESIAMQDVELTISVLQTLQNMGIQVSMDDFGTGYSSLSYLKHFPLDTLKIDRSFIQDLITDSTDAAIIRAIIALGHGLNLKVIAEGVETPEQLEFLQSEKCDGIQGYLFSRPLPAEAATELLQLKNLK